MKKPSKAEIANAVQRFKTMPASQVRDELARIGIDPQPTIDAVKALVSKATAEHASAASLHPASAEPPREAKRRLKIVTRVPNARRPSSLRVVTTNLKPDALRRVFLSPVATRARIAEAIAWPLTHAHAIALRNARCEGRDAVRVVNEVFADLSEAAACIPLRGGGDFDAAWPLLEAFVETGIEVSRDERLWGEFAGRYAMVAVSSEPALQCMFVHGLHQLFALGAAARELATCTALEILRMKPDPDAGMLLIRIAQRHRLHHKASDLLGAVDPATRDKAAAIDAAKHDALQNFPKLRVRNAEESFFSTRPVATLVDCLTTDTLSSYLAMYALGEVYLCAATLIAHDPKPRQKKQHEVFAQRIAEQLRPPGLRFLTCGSLEQVRDKYPRFAAGLMASLVDDLPTHARAAVFVCAAEGYERSFQGNGQARTPHFAFEEGPTFRFTAPHDLDVFGTRVCASGAAEELRPHMKWMNQRLERWIEGR